MLDDIKFVSHKDPHDELGEIERRWRERSKALARAAENWRADKPTEQNLAKQVAEHLAGKSVVVYAQDQILVDTWYTNIALRAQTRVFGVAMKNTSIELAAWRSQPVDKLFAVVLLRSQHDSKTTHNNFELMLRQLSGIWPHPLTVWLEGRTVQEEVHWAQFLAELSSAYLAVLGGINPGLVE